MANLILTRRFTSQPQYPVELAPDYLKDSALAFNFSSPLARNFAAQGNGKILTPVNAVPAVGPMGAGIRATSDKAYVNLAYGNPIVTSDGAGTGDYLIAGVIHPKPGSRGDVLHIRNNVEPFQQLWVVSNGFYAENATSGTAESGAIYFGTLQSASSGGYSARGVKASGVVTGTPISFAAHRKSGVFSLWVNGSLVASNNASATINSVSGGTQGIAIGGFTVATTVPFVDTIHTLYAANRALYDGEGAELTSNPWQIFRRSPQILYFDTAGGGATTLTIADAVHGHTADNLGLTSSHMLTIADSTHAHSADNVSLTTQILLALADALHGHTADNLTLSTTGSTSLVAADATHAHTADNLSLTALSVLVVAEALHAHLADNVVLSVAGATNLIVADALHAHSADNLSLTSQLALSIAEAAHAHASDNIVITSQHVLAVADALHAHMADNLTLSDAPALIVADASHAHAADNLALTSASLLAIADAAHAHLADNVSLTYAATLAIIEAMHAHLADNITLSLVALRTVEMLIAAARDTQLTAPTRDTLLESRHAVHG